VNLNLHLRTLLTLGTLGILGAMWAPQAWAHKPSDSYVQLVADAERPTVDVTWHIALRDLDNALHLDADDDGRLTWGEVRQRWDEIQRYAQPHLRADRAGHACTPDTSAPPAAPALIGHTDGQYAVLAWRWHCPTTAASSTPGAAPLTLHYDLFALEDPTHRGVLRWQVQQGQRAGPPRVAVLGAQQADLVLAGTALSAAPSATEISRATQSASDAAPSSTAIGQVVPASLHASAPSSRADVGTAAASTAPQPSALQAVWTMVKEGVHHIGEGTDHILFLVTLLLVAVWRRPAASSWEPRAGWGEVLTEAAKLVTAFTVAHSVTLALSTFGVVAPPSRWVESLIALSVLAAAIDNLIPILPQRRWAVVGVFGLVHGFGFAGVMQDLGLQGAEVIWPLLGFNLGVEAGQLMLVAAFLPVAFALRRTWAYRVVGVQLGSACIAGLAAVWLFERSTDAVVLGW